MRNVSVVGNSGSGKSTLSRSIAEALGVIHVEIDAIYHQPGWMELPEAELVTAIDAATSGDGWVIDGNYSAVTDLVWARADTVVWLDLPRSLIMRQILARTTRRVVRREELWNGNRERVGKVLHPDPERSIIRWAWTQHDRYVQRYEARMADPRWSTLDVLRLRSRTDVGVFLRSLPRPSRPGSS